MAFDLEHDVAVHEAALAALRIQQKRDERASLKEQLADTRQKLRLARAEHSRLAAQIIAQQDARLDAHKKILDLLEKIGDHSHSRPACADFLPFDPEVVAWEQHHAKLVAARERVTAEMPAEPDRRRASLLQNDIVQLQFAEGHCIEKLRGGLGKIPSGGIFAPLGGRIG